MAMRRRHTFKSRLAWAEDKYVSMIVASDKCYIETNSGRLILTSKSKCRKMYLKLVEELLKEYGYVFEKV